MAKKIKACQILLWTVSFNCGGLTSKEHDHHHSGGRKEQSGSAVSSTQTIKTLTVVALEMLCYKVKRVEVRGAWLAQSTE